MKRFVSLSYNNIIQNVIASYRLSGKETNKFYVQREIGQAHTILPKLFSIFSQHACKTPNLDANEMNMNEKFLSHLRFVDDIDLITDHMEIIKNVEQYFVHACWITN